MKTILPVENQDPLSALQGFFKKLLDAGLVDLLLVPMRTESSTLTHALVSNPTYLDHADPLAPVLPANSATLAGKISSRQPRARVGVVMRSCEVRALVELVKMQQASLDDLVVIAMDCAGTYNVPTFLKKITNQQSNLWQELYNSAANTPATPNPELRTACQICEQPVYNGASITIELFGSDPTQAIHLSLPDDMANTLGLQASQPSERGPLIDKLISARQAQRDAEFAKIRLRLEGDEGITGLFSACIRCHNCMTVCPICYCKTCVFKSAVFDHAPMQFVDWSRQKGAYRMPPDTMLFHLTRMNHMALSCVGCGMCTEACPSELPVGMVFRAVGQRLQQTFEYLPGRDVSESLPLVTFKADEWTEVGE
jgi:formate dehydrogenase subunit beta